ncbi:uncharacterized protein LOC143876425 [Tasmannia lanceolata]|uniref:uncharacterized protein LOC143876425 n=1 Tax=Tasmannia lanceolata TaxID=3420 RepID=UPI004063380A
MTPFEALYGRKPPTIPDYIRGSSKVDQVDSALLQRDQLLQLLKANLLRAQLRMKHQADKHRADREYKVGDWVFLKLQPYRQSIVASRTSHKFSRRYFGPFQILERIGSVAYRLSLPEGSKIHPTFHVSLIKPCVGDPSSHAIPLPPVTTESHPLVQPSQVLATRTIQRGQSLCSQVLIQWSGLPPSDATWEDASEIQRLFPALNLEDKVPFDGGRNVTPGHLGHQPSSDATPARVPARHRLRPSHLADYVHMG